MCALIKLAAPFSELKGVVGGNIFQGYRGQTVIRARTSCGGRNSERWDDRKNFLGGVSGEWRNLTSQQQVAWTAAAPSFPYTDKFGDPQIPSGFQLFVTLNYFNIRAGNPPNTAPPAPVTQIVFGPLSVSIPDPATMNVSWAGATSATVVLNISASPVQSKGVTVNPTRTRAIRTVISTLAQPVNVAPDWVTAYGAVPASGRFFFNMFAVSGVSWEKWGQQFAFDDL